MLRRLIADSQGKIEIAQYYGKVGLTVTQIVSGTLDDPNFPTRPVGTNHLEVVLLDEAAYASNNSVSGFEGTWTLTRRPDGILTVSAIVDTPYPAKLAEERRRLLGATRAGLRGTVEQRLVALDTLDKHPFLEVVPQVIALLDDPRSDSAQPQAPSSGRDGPRVVSAVAGERLRKLVGAFEVGRAPLDDDIAKWTAFWRQILAGDPAGDQVLAAPITKIVEVAMNQSFPELVALADGAFALTVSRMQKAIDGHQDGLFLTRPPYATRTWVDAGEREEIDVAAGGGGTFGVLSANSTDQWTFAIVTPGATSLPKAPAAFATVAKHAALASTGSDYLAAYITEQDRALFVRPYDGTGRPKVAARKVSLKEQPAAWYHRGFHALKLVHRTGGWMAAIEMKGSVTVVSLDDKLALAAPPTRLADAMDFAQPTLVASADRAFVTWIHDRSHAAQLAFAVVRPDGTLLSAVAMTGSEVWQLSRPVVLEDGGFAVAWIEAEDELHVGRWTADGKLVKSVIVAPSGALWLSIALGRDPQGRLVVAYQDATTYPFALLTRHVDLSSLR